MATEIQLPLDQMTVAEKLAVIDTVWNDLLKRGSEIPVPDWQLKLLEQSERAVADGIDEFVELEEFEALLWEEIEQRKGNES